MKILIISDSHGRNTYLDRVLTSVGPIDMLLHMGDLEGSENYIMSKAGCPVEMVSGNNDYFTDIPRDKIVRVGSYKVFMTHGHRYQVNFGLDTIKQAGRERGVDIVMFGHTHVPLIDYDDIIIVNPGSISQPRQKGRIPTYAIMDIDRFGEAHFTISYVKI